MNYTGNNVNRLISLRNDQNSTNTITHSQNPSFSGNSTTNTSTSTTYNYAAPNAAPNAPRPLTAPSQTRRRVTAPPVIASAPSYLAPSIFDRSSSSTSSPNAQSNGVYTGPRPASIATGGRARASSATVTSAPTRLARSFPPNGGTAARPLPVITVHSSHQIPRHQLGKLSAATKQIHCLFPIHPNYYHQWVGAPITYYGQPRAFGVDPTSNTAFVVLDKLNNDD